MVSRILFGSCNSQSYEQPLWPAILRRQATAWIWAGDAIYADQNVGLDWSTFPPHPQVLDATPQVLEQLYKEQRDHALYSQLIQNTTIFGTFDDHDYGANNGDSTYKYKRESAMAFVQTFLGMPEDSVMSQRARTGKGAYGVKVFDFSRDSTLLTDDEAGVDAAVPETESTNYSEKSVAVFAIDVRSHKTPWKSGWRKFLPDYEGDFLGNDQWIWLEESLRRSNAKINVIVTGLQVHADRYPDGNIAEAWSKFPTAQARLYNAIMQSNVSAPILVSGDVHHAQLLRKDCFSSAAAAAAATTITTRPLVEITTSGLTHSWGVQFCSRPDGNFLCQSTHTTMATRFAMTMAHLISPWRDLIEAKGWEGAKNGLQYSLNLNFGEIDVDWDEGAVQVRVHGLDEETPLLSQRWTIDQLNGHTKMEGGTLTMADFENSSSQGAGPWNCLNHRGPTNPVHLLFTSFLSLMICSILLFYPLTLAIMGGCWMSRRSHRQSTKLKAI